MQAFQKTLQSNVPHPVPLSPSSLFYLDFEDRELIYKITTILSSIGLVCFLHPFNTIENNEFF